VPAILVGFEPAPEPRDGRAVSEQDLIASLRQRGVEAQPAHWRSIGDHVGGKGGGIGEIAQIAIGVIVSGFVFRVATSFADALGKELFEQFKRSVQGIVSRKEDQLRRARLEGTFQLGHGQWLFFWEDAKDLEKYLGKPRDMKIAISDEEPRIWFLSLEKRRFLFFERGRWSIRAYPFQEEPPPSLPT